MTPGRVKCRNICNEVLLEHSHYVSKGWSGEKVERRVSKCAVVNKYTVVQSLIRSIRYTANLLHYTAGIKGSELE